MLDVNTYGVVALDQGALAKINGGGGCDELAHAIGFGVGEIAHRLIHAALSGNYFWTLMEDAAEA